MSKELRIPKIGMSATEMILGEWMFADGEAVKAGDIIYTTEIEAQDSGILRVIGVEGESYAVGTLIGTIE
jgi:pyruvate/2-oxoglutarate dehydrogenase complex dihydrolipoamide acyltransferase (E2) component